MNYYVTTSIPYANGDPHIGFAMELIMADVMARSARQRGETTLYSTGTDEHGTKVAEKAQELKLQPKVYADQISTKFSDLCKQLNVSNDRFIRTTDPAHEERAQIIWKNLSADIYKGKYSGLYCTGCEAFVTEQVAKEHGNVCPHHNKPYQKLEEENYFFKLSKYTPVILDAINKGTFKIYPEKRKHEILGVFKKGLEDFSISRPKASIAWGIPVPGDDTQVMYVWFEALMNYITVLGYPEHKDFKDFWPANVQVVGKDILRFHAANWPGMLLALKLPLPGTLYVHGFVTVDDSKMSKSIGNVIAPADIIKRYGTDAFRYYFLRHIPSYNDGDFSWEKLDSAYNDELADQLGNTVQRTMVMIQKYQNGIVGNTPSSEHDRAGYDQSLAECRFDRALDDIWEQIKGLNQYIDEEKPWIIAKSKDAEHLQEVLAYQVSSILQIADLLTPFLPDTSAKIKAIFSSGIIRPAKGTLFPKAVKTDKSATPSP